MPQLRQALAKEWIWFEKRQCTQLKYAAEGILFAVRKSARIEGEGWTWQVTGFQGPGAVLMRFNYNGPDTGGQVQMSHSSLLRASGPYMWLELSNPTENQKDGCAS